MTNFVFAFFLQTVKIRVVEASDHGADNVLTIKGQVARVAGLPRP